MSGRGARSRKAIVKDIEKKEKKSLGKEKAVEPIRRPHDAFTEWAPTPSHSSRDTTGTGIPARSVTISSDGSRASAVSRSSSVNPNGSRPRLNTINSIDSLERSLHRPKTSQSGSTSVSGGSSKGKEKLKYQAKGKETKAPRGRGGGVPIKRPTLASPSPPLFRSETSASYGTPTSNKTWINFKIWQGGDAGLKPYGGFEYDEHMQTGNVLIYFKEEQTSDDRPVPQIRAELDVLENSGSTWLTNALLYGRIDENDDEWSLPGSPESSGSRQNYPPINQTSGGRKMLSPTSMSGMSSPPPFNIDDQAYFGVPPNGTASRAQYYTGSDRSGNARSPSSFPQPPTHELWFTAPSHIKTLQGQRLHHVAIRNFLAMLHNKPIVGADVFEMLNTLQPEIEVMYDLDHDNQSRLTPRERSVQMITNYLSHHKLDDVRNSIKLALGLLAWAEQDNVKWREGYLESFAHLAGIMSPQIEELPDFKRLSIVTRRNLGIAAKSLQLRVMEAEEKLGAFDFGDLWDDSIKTAGGAVNQSYQSFRQFLTSYYTKIYGDWPPNQGKTWLNRRMVLGLQEDFGALYDYLVNRDVVWDSREERPGKKWEMVNKREEDFRADLPELSITDMLVTFDNRHGYLHIPQPYPLLPREVPHVKKVAPKKSLFGGLKKPKVDTTKDAKAHLQLSIVFSDATNIDKSDFSINGSTLIDAFERFELTTDLKTLTPREARLGRWVLLYGVLQVLSTLSVDIHDLKWSTGVRYFLCTDLKRCPEWVTQGQVEHTEAGQLRSWCWTRPWGNINFKRAPVELEASNLQSNGELDGATMLDDDIRRISEKIEDMGRSSRPYNPTYERRLENEKIKQEDFSKTKRMDDSYRLTETDFIHQQQELLQQQRPLVPPRSELRSPNFRSGHDSLRAPSAMGNYDGSRAPSGMGMYERERVTYDHLRAPSAMGAHEFPVPPGSNGSRGYYQEERGGWAS